MDMDQLAAIADEFRHRVREEDDPDVNGRWLADVCPEWADRYRLLFVLAAAIPVDRDWLKLTAWAAPKPDPNHVDEIAVERACRGEDVQLTTAERKAAVVKMSQRGMTVTAIARRLRMSNRSVVRARQVAS